MKQSPVAAPRTFAGLPRRVAAGYSLLFCTVLLVYGFAWRNAMFETGDTHGYYETAQDLADFHLDQLHDRSPGYPLLLLATGATAHPTARLFFISLLLHLASVWLLAFTLHTAGGSAKWLVVLIVLLALPPYVQSAAGVLTENLTEFCLVAAFAAIAQWFRTRRTVLLPLASLALGYSALTRPTYQFLALAIAVTALPAACALGLFARREAIKVGMLLMLGSAILTGGFSAINYARFGYFGVTPMLGLHLSTRTVRFWDRIPDEDRVVKEVLLNARDAELTQPNSSHTGAQSIYHARPELLRATGMNDVELARHLLRMNLGLIRRAPLNYLQEVGRALGGSYWFPASNRLTNMNSDFVQFVWAALHFLIVAFFFAGCVALMGSVGERMARNKLRIGLSQEMKTRIVVYGLAAAIVFYTMIISCMVDVGDPRHRLPTDGLILWMAFLAPLLWRRITATECFGLVKEI